MPCQCALNRQCVYFSCIDLNRKKNENILFVNLIAIPNFSYHFTRTQNCFHKGHYDQIAINFSGLIFPVFYKLNLFSIHFFNLIIISE